MNRWVIPTTAFLMLVAFDSGLLAADNAIRAGALELYPTFECVGVRLAYQGDANANATAGLRFREKGAVAWREALPLARIRGNRFAGSIFFLTPGRDYEVEVSLNDPDGMERGKINGSVSTREFSFPAGNGKQWYVSAQGVDDGKGTEAQPFRTIGRAAARAGAGDVVHVLPGVYRESVTVSASGRADAYIAFRAEGAGVILSGADPHYESLEAGERWSEAGDGVWSTELASRPGYVGANGLRLYHYLSREEFERFICGAPGGWHQDPTGKLFVRLAGGANPNDLPMQVAVLDCGFHLQGASCVLIEGFEIRDYGLSGSGSGVHLDRTGRCVVRDCSIHGMQSQVLLSGPEAEGNLIENCELWDTSLPDWPWAMTKAHEEEGGGVMSTGGRGNVVRGCRMHGLFDGLAPSYWDKLDDEQYNCDWDVYDNEIFYLRDDIMEPEGPCINFRIWNNVCYDLFAGISLAPIQVGPAYVVYNSVGGTKIKDIKYSGEEPGWSYILNNTFYSGDWQHNTLDITEPFQTQFFRNNIFSGNSYTFRLKRRPLPGNDIDYDCWFSTDLAWFRGYTGLKDMRLFFIDNREYPFIEDIRKEFGWEAHGIQADPLFADPLRGDFTLRPESPCVDRGVVLPNINERYVGAAPDMGAFERGRAAGGRFPLERSPSAR